MIVQNETTDVKTLERLCLALGIVTLMRTRFGSNWFNDDAPSVYAIYVLTFGILPYF
jgi:hypothetical protein